MKKIDNPQGFPILSPIAFGQAVGFVSNVVLHGCLSWIFCWLIFWFRSWGSGTLRDSFRSWLTWTCHCPWDLIWPLFWQSSKLSEARPHFQMSVLLRKLGSLTPKRLQGSIFHTISHIQIKAGPKVRVRGFGKGAEVGRVNFGSVSVSERIPSYPSYTWIQWGNLIFFV